MHAAEKISKVLDLSSYESRVYIALHHNGPLHVQNIAKFTRIPRTAIYSPLVSLKEKGLVSETIFGKRKYYSAVTPENLRAFFNEKKDLLEQVIAELSESRNMQSKESGLESTLHVGMQGIKSAGLLFLNETKEKTWYSFENLVKVADSVSFEFENFYIKERVSRGIRSKMILSLDEESPALRKILREDKTQLRETILLSPNEYPFQTTVVATKGLILLINPNDNKFALLIRNRHLADTFIQIHRCIWDRYRG